jgi:hypothetical protein
MLWHHVPTPFNLDSGSNAIFRPDRTVEQDKTTAVLSDIFQAHSASVAELMSTQYAVRPLNLSLHASSETLSTSNSVQFKWPALHRSDFLRTLFA